MKDWEVICELRAGNRLLKQERYKLLEKIEKLERKNHCAYSEGRNKGFEDGKRNADNLEERIKELERKLEKYQWIPVSERLPEVPLGPPNASSESVWLIFKGKPQMGYYANYGRTLLWRIYGIRFQKRFNQKDVTHWKPIILP